MASFGNVTSVVERPVGTTLALAASAGAGTVTVDDISKLTWPIGGMRIGNEWHTYYVDASPDPAVDVIDLDENDEGADEEGTLTITPALVGSYDVDEPVVQFQQTAVIERLATVMLPDQQEELVLRVPRGLWDRLPTGIRQRDLTPETVALEVAEGEWVMTDVVGEDPSLDGSYIDYTTLPIVSQPHSAGAGVSSSAFFTEPWANPNRVTDADDSWASATGTSTTATVTAHNTGFKLPTAADDDSAVGTTSWSTVNGILAVGGNQAVDGSAGNSHYLEATDFGFSVPVGATITGVFVQISRFQGGSHTTTEVADNHVKLIKGGVVSGTDKATDVAWPISQQAATYGGNGDLWGLALTSADVNASDFGVALSVSDGEGHPKFVDWIKVKINYTTTSTTDHRSNTKFLVASGFHFTIPSEATVNAITVDIQRHASDNTGDDYATDNQIRVVAGGDVSPSVAHSAHWPTVDTVATYGSGNLWGFDELTADDINASNFAVWLSADVNAGVTAYVDLIQVTVAYVAPAIDAPTQKLLDIGPSAPTPPPPPVDTFLTLLESDDELLLETGDQLLSEEA